MSNNITFFIYMPTNFAENILHICFLILFENDFKKYMFKCKQLFFVQKYIVYTLYTHFYMKTIIIYIQDYFIH